MAYLIKKSPNRIKQTIFNGIDV